MLLAIISSLLLAIILYLLLRPIISGAMYFPAPPDVVRKIIEVIGVGSGQRIADLGSGDGRIVIALAKAGADAVGYEINPQLVALSRHRIKKLGLAAHANIYWKSFWHEDLSRFDAIIVYGYPPIMEKLGAKLKREMKPGAKVISLVYPFPGRSPDESRETGQYKLYIYRYPGA